MRIGTKYTTNEEIQKEVLRFYKGFLGTAATTLPAVDVAMLRVGPQVSPNDVAALIQPITT